MLKNSKKILSLLLSLIMIISVFTGLEISSVAEDTECKHTDTYTWKQQNPTCFEPGYTAAVYCFDCGELVSGGDEIPQSEHIPMIVSLPGSAPSCEYNGYEPGEYCISCDEWVSGHSVLPPNGKHIDNDNDFWCDCCVNYDMDNANENSIKIFLTNHDSFYFRVAFKEKYESLKAEIYYDKEKITIIDTSRTDQSREPFDCEISDDKITVSSGLSYWIGAYEPAVIFIDYELLDMEPTDITVKITEINGESADISDVATINPKHIDIPVPDCAHSTSFSKFYNPIIKPSCFTNGYTNDGKTDGAYCDGCNTWFEGHVEIPAFGAHIDEDKNFECDRCYEVVEIKKQNDLSYGIIDNEAVIVDVDYNLSNEYIIPDSIDGYPVTQISYINWDYSAFSDIYIKSLILPATIKNINADVFSTVKNIYYAGSQEQWNNIDIDESNNESLNFAIIHFNSTGPDNPTAENMFESEFINLNQQNIKVPESKIKKTELPFAWEDVQAYCFDGKYAMFLTIDSSVATLFEEHDSGWKEYTHTISYKLYYTEDFEEFKTAEYTVDTSRYSDISDSSCLYDPIGIETTDKDEIPYYYGYDITNISDDTYFINTSAWGDADWVFSFGAIFNDGKVSLMEPDIHGNIFVAYDDCYILIDSIKQATIKDVELLSAPDEDDIMPYYEYNLTLAPSYYYSEDLENWTQKIGGAETKITTSSYNQYVPGDTINEFKYFEAEVNTNNILTLRYRPDHPQMISYEPHGNANISFDGKDFICLDKIFKYETPFTFWKNNDGIYAVNNVYSSENRAYGYTNIVKYNFEGAIISEQKLKFTEEWVSAASWNDSIFEYTTSLKDSNDEFLKSYTFRIKDDSELKVFETEFDIRNVISGNELKSNDENINIMLFDNSICLYSDSNPYNIKYITTNKDYTDLQVFNSSVYLFADDIYTISEATIQDIISGKEITEEPPTTEPTTKEPETEVPTTEPTTKEPETEVPTTEPTTKEPETQAPTTEPSTKPVEKPTEKPVSDKLDAGNTIKVDNAAKTTSIGVKQTAESIAKSIKNDKFAIVDKSGNTLKKDALVGTGAKIQIMNNDNKVISEYTVIVPTDVDGNGKTTAADARLALRGSAKLKKIEGVYAQASDMNADSKVTAADARKILRISANLEKI